MTRTEQTNAPAAAHPDPQREMDVAIRAARLSAPLIDGDHGVRYAFVPDGFSLREITHPDNVPPDIRQAVTLDDAESLIRYVNRFSDNRSVLVADIDAARVTAILDYHGDNQTGALVRALCAHTAHLQLRQSEELRRWSEMEGKLHSQAVFAEFLDENAVDIVDPEPAVMIEIARDLEATQGVTFKASNRLQTGERSLTYETETRAHGDMIVPQRFVIEVPLFVGEEPVRIDCSFRFRILPDGLKLGFVWRRLEYRRQAEFTAIAHRVSEATGRPVVMGRL